MASATTNNNTVSKYDLMSQEELITQCKRQLLLLKNLKIKCDHLQKSLTENNVNNKKIKSQVQTVQQMQLEIDKLKDKLDIKNKEKIKIQKMLDDITQQLNVKIEQNLEASKNNRSLQNSFEESVEDSKITVFKLEKKAQDLFNENKNLKQRIKNLEDESKDLNEKLVENCQKLQNSQVKLEEIEKIPEALKKTTLKLNESNEKIKRMNKKIAEYENCIDRMQQKYEVDTDEREIRHMRTLETAQKSIECLNKIESGLKSKVDELNNHIDTMQNSIDLYQVDIEKEKKRVKLLENALKNSITKSEKNKLLMQQKISELKTSIDNVVLEKNSISSEYESYKVRVYSVLKKQKGKETKNELEEKNKAELEKEQNELKELKACLLQSQKTIVLRENELCLLQKDYNTLFEKQQLESDMAVDKDKKWNIKLKLMQNEITNTRKANVEQMIILKGNNQDLLTANEKVVKELDHFKNKFQEYKIRLFEKNDEINDLKKQLENKMEILPIDRNTTKVVMTSNSYKSDITMLKREEGEGAEEEVCSTSTCDDIKSLESLIEGPKILSVKMKSKIDYTNNDAQCKSLERKVVDQDRKIKHLSIVCRESEQTSARLLDQNKLLKEEIRRLERNESRKESVSNLEYLKNIIIKFIKLPPSDERSHLVPVIDTMLQLTHDEKSALQTIAQGESNEQAQESWGGYFQRWVV